MLRRSLSFAATVYSRDARRGNSQALFLDWLDGNFDSTRDELIDDLIALWLSIGDAAATTVQRRIER